MIFRECRQAEQQAVVALFVAAFADSEGEAEGALIGELVEALFASSAAADLCNYVAEVDGEIVGAIFLSRMVFANENAVFILSPVAVASGHQGQGIGQALIQHGLRELQKQGVEFVLTYGDPRFYAKVGFRPVSSEVVRPPFALSQPEGWLGQSLCGRPVESLRGESTCVPALSNPVYW
ncbi:MAG: N-acetyltransferase [Gammaproteobacteria bacterium]|nr:N-acetyltransferase [Gammaproteobacteria bacterium]